MRFLFREKFLIYRDTPEGPRPPEQNSSSKISQETLESIEETRSERRDLEVDITTEAAKEATPEAKKTNEEFKTKAQLYYEALLQAETPEKLAEILQKAQSDEVSLIDLQGGWEWLGLSEEEQEKKHALLSKVFLNKIIDGNGQEVFVVKDELNRQYKTKYGLGAGHMIPPSIAMAEITDNRGRSRQGKREIRANRVGYFDDNGYIPVFAGYQIKPISFIAENSEEYKGSVNKEKQHYVNLRDSAAEVEDAVSHVPQNITDYSGKQDYPIANLSSLKSKSREAIAEQVDENEVKKIEMAKTDLKRIEATLDNNSLRMDSRSEVNGGSFIVSLEGRGAQILGYGSESLALEQEWLSKLNDYEFIAKNTQDGKLKLEYKDKLTSTLNVELKDGKYIFADESGKVIEDLETWVIQNAAKISEKSETTKLIEAMQNGGTYEDQKFKAGEYELNITQLLALYNLTENKQTAQTLLTNLNKNGEKISPKKLIEKLYNQPTMNLAEAQQYAAKNSMDMLTSGTIALENLYYRNDRPGFTEFSHNYDAQSQNLTYNNKGEGAWCALTVSTLLGLPQKEGKVSELVSRILRGNQEKYGNDGIVFGFENYKKGDVVVWRRDDNGSYRHVAIVRDTINIDGQKFIAVQHDEDAIQINLIPVKQDGSVNKLNGELHTNPEELISRQSPEDQAKLRSILDYRADHLAANPNVVRITPNASWFGDASKDGGKVNSMLFAVRTDWSNQESTPALADLKLPPVLPGAPAIPRVPSPAVEVAPAASQKTVTESNEKLITNLQRDIEKITENMKGTVAVNIYDPDTGKYLARINENKITPSASLIKVPILFALHKAVKLGKVAEKDVPRLQKCAEKMIADSNNTTTNEIINYLGMEFINQCIQELGLKDTKLNRLMLGPGEGRNWTSAQDMTKALNLALTQEPPAGWASAMDLMQINGHTGKLGEMIPQDVKIARKCGQISDQEHYAAIYTLGKKRLAIVVMVSDFDTRNNAKDGIRKIGMLAYDALKNKT